jgi:hypothetical protein
LTRDDLGFVAWASAINAVHEGMVVACTEAEEDDEVDGWGLLWMERIPVPYIQL